MLGFVGVIEGNLGEGATDTQEGALNVGAADGNAGAWGHRDCWIRGWKECCAIRLPGWSLFLAAVRAIMAGHLGDPRCE